MIDFKRFLKAIGVKNVTDSTKELILTVDNTATTSTSTTLVANQTANRTVTLPDLNGTLATVDGVETFENKTIDADNNTILNISNDEIKVGAGIDAAKIADGTVSNEEFQYLNGVNAPIQDQIDSIASGTGTASNLGAGEGVFAQKVVSDFQFKSLVEGSNIVVSSDADEITIGLDTTQNIQSTKTSTWIVGTENKATGNSSGIQLSSGDATTGNTSSVFVSSGHASGSTGSLNLRTGASSTTNSGFINLISGQGQVDSGAVTVSSGTATTGNSGSVTISTGTAVGGTAGDINLTSAIGSTTRGDINLTADRINLLADVEIDANNKKIVNLATPTNALDAVNKDYIDSYDVTIRDYIDSRTTPVYARRTNLTSIPVTSGSGTFLVLNTVLSSSTQTEADGGLLIPENGVYELGVFYFATNTTENFTAYNEFRTYPSATLLNNTTVTSLSNVLVSSNREATCFLTYIGQFTAGEIIKVNRSITVAGASTTTIQPGAQFYIKKLG